MRTLFNSSYHKKNKQSVGETDDFSCFLFVYYMWKHAQKMHKTSNFKIPNWNLTSITHFLMLLIRSTKNYLLYIIFNIIISSLTCTGKCYFNCLNNLSHKWNKNRIFMRGYQYDYWLYLSVFQFYSSAICLHIVRAFK